MGSLKNQGKRWISCETRENNEEREYTHVLKQIPLRKAEREVGEGDDEHVESEASRLRRDEVGYRSREGVDGTACQPARDRETRSAARKGRSVSQQRM